MRRIEHDRPRLSGWTSPNPSVRRYRLPCLSTWTEPRSVALTIGRTTGSMKRVASVLDAGAGGWAIVGLREVGEAIGLVRHDEGVDERIELAFEDAGDVVDRRADPVVGDPVVGEVVGPDLLRPVPRLDHGPAGGGVTFALLCQLQVVQPRAQ